MPKTIKLELHLHSEELENRYRKAYDPVLRSHYQILWLISEGKTTSQVMESTGYSRGWIQQIARRYNASGPEALGDRRHQNPGAREAPARWRDVELPQGRGVDREQDRPCAHSEKAEGLGVHEEVGPKPQGAKASS